MTATLPSRETAIIGTMLELDGGDLPPNLSRLLANAPESFDNPRLGCIAVAVRSLRNSGKPVYELTVSEALQSQRTPDGAFVTLSESASQALPIDLAEIEAETVWRSYQTRQTKTLLVEAAEAIDSNPQQAANIASHVRRALDDLNGEAGPTLASRLFSPTTKPDKPTPRFFINGSPTSTAGNLTTISAQAKAGKTAIIAAMISAAAHDPDVEVDCLGFGSGNLEGKALVHFDTEQSPFDHHELIERALRRAKVGAAPSWLRSYCLTGFATTEARRSIRRGIEAANRECGGIHSVLIDGVGDLVHDVNDPAEANDFVNELHALAIEFACPIVAVIHLNPGSDFKTRGHLGSQLERKAETNLRLEKDGEAIILWADKNRRAPIPKEHGPRFAWNDELGMHVSVDRESDPGSTGKTKADLLAQVPVAGAIAQTVILERGNAAGIGQKKCRAFLDELLSDGALHLWLVHRRGTNPEKRISRQPQPVQQEAIPA